jgi:hypothetical protein
MLRALALAIATMTKTATISPGPVLGSPLPDLPAVEPVEVELVASEEVPPPEPPAEELVTLELPPDGAWVLAEGLEAGEFGVLVDVLEVCGIELLLPVLVLVEELVELLEVLLELFDVLLLLSVGALATLVVVGLWLEWTTLR